ncbi:efflux RND transporter periplasmic adaptor subunit, partial [Singulisphaera rosea]
MSTETESAPGRPPKVPQGHGWLPIGAFLVVIAAGVAWWSRSPSTKSPGVEESASGASDDGQERIRVDVVHPEPGGLKRTSTQIGSVHSFEYATLYAKVSGYLKWQQVDIGSLVK